MKIFRSVLVIMLVFAFLGAYVPQSAQARPGPEPVGDATLSWYPNHWTYLNQTIVVYDRSWSQAWPHAGYEGSITYKFQYADGTWSSRTAPLDWVLIQKFGFLYFKSFARFPADQCGLMIISGYIEDPQGRLYLKPKVWDAGLKECCAPGEC